MKTTHQRYPLAPLLAALVLALLAGSSAQAAWTTNSPLAVAREIHTGTLLPSGKVLVVGGFGSSGATNSAELYDPATGKWAATGGLLTKRGYHTATLLPNGKVLVAGGYGTSSFLSSSELYDPVAGTWTSTGTMAAARYGHTATLLTNGLVLVAGGAVITYMVPVFG